jgi:hypothetical protein
MSKSIIFNIQNKKFFLNIELHHIDLFIAIEYFLRRHHLINLTFHIKKYKKRELILNSEKN